MADDKTPDDKTPEESDPIYRRAEEAFKKRNYDYARDLFVQLVHVKPDSAKAREALRATLIKKFQEMGATGKLRLMAMRTQFELQLKATKDAGKRADLCTNFLLDDPTNAKIRGLLAEILLAQGHPHGAASEARMALESDGSSVAAAKTLVAAYKSTGKVKEAQSILEKVSQMAPNDRDIERLQRDLAAMQTMSAGFEDAKDFRDVIKNKQQAEELEKKQHLIQTDADFDLVVKNLQGELSVNPTDARIPKRLGDLYYDKKKEYATAKDWYAKAAQLAPQDSVLRDKVDDCQLKMFDLQIEPLQKTDPKYNEMRAQRVKFQIQSFERRVSDRPTDMALRFELGKAYFSVNLIDKSIGEFQQAVRDPKRQVDSFFYLGRAFHKKKMFDMADKQFNQAAEKVLSQERKLEILYYRMHCCRDAGKKEQAVALGQQIMEADITFKDVAELVEKWQAEQ
jgi:tetratricopeptide (TPR) repeat protein